MSTGKGAACIGDMTSGHDGYPGTPIISGSDTLICNGKGVACTGDKCDDHNKPKVPNHTPIITGGSSFFKVNGKAVAMVGTAVAGNCSEDNKIISGSDTLIINE